MTAPTERTSHDATLTDRYVEATLRRLPEGQRPDIERELRASIADAVDGRVEAGRRTGRCGAAVLTELGDPRDSPPATPTGHCTSSAAALYPEWLPPR